MGQRGPPVGIYLSVGATFSELIGAQLSAIEVAPSMTLPRPLVGRQSRPDNGGFRP
jgi:hypothetical protein